MMQPRDRTLLEDIITHATQAIAYSKGMNVSTFIQDEKTQDAVLRKLEVIGEAARRLSDDTRLQYRSIHWHEWISLRNRLIHTYDSVDLSIVWRTITIELPSLISSIQAILAE